MSEDERQRDTESNEASSEKKPSLLQQKKQLFKSLTGASQTLADEDIATNVAQVRLSRSPFFRFGNSFRQGDTDPVDSVIEWDNDYVDGMARKTDVDAVDAPGRRIDWDTRDPGT